MSYTPGPWTIERQLVATIEGTTDPVHFYSVEVPAVCGGGIALVSMGGRGKENARLLAASPELLEALIGIVNEFQPYVSTETDSEIQMRERAWLDQASVAIAKATKGA